MLRRKPTPIKLTADDIALYDEFKRAQENKSGNGAYPNPHDGAKTPVNTALDPRVRQRVREDRMGVAGSRQ